MFDFSIRDGRPRNSQGWTKSLFVFVQTCRVCGSNNRDQPNWALKNSAQDLRSGGWFRFSRGMRSDATNERINALRTPQRFTGKDQQIERHEPEAWSP